MLLTAPGFRVNGPADCTKRRSPAGLLFVDSSQPFGYAPDISAPAVDQCNGSEVPGNM